MVGGRPEKQATGDDHKKGGGKGAGHNVSKTKGSRTNLAVVTPDALYISCLQSYIVHLVFGHMEVTSFHRNNIDIWIFGQICVE
jgi:hypothetical protein